MNPSLIPSLLSALARFPSSNVVENQYSDPAILRNVEQYLRDLCQLPYSGYLLVGEAAGHRGCARTGIPFTSERMALMSPHPFLLRLRPKLTLRTSVTESTATIVWTHLSSCVALPAFWNVFPFHPHDPGNTSTNRQPTGAEIAAGRPSFDLICKILSPQKMIAVGNLAASSIAGAAPARHPSFGGKNKYISDVTAAGIA
jgi:uracil-DNA glycosylase